VSKHWKPAKTKVELNAAAKPSRIRRDPVPTEKPARLKGVYFASSEWEIGLAIAGIVLFALAINAMVFDLGEFLG
jgi:hypothetical protein